MPRFSTIRLTPLRELAKQLRFAPKSAAVRQVRAVLRLAAEIDPARAYGRDWLVRRITGYRSDESNAAQLVGEALLADLSAFAEKLSEQSRLDEEDLGAPVVSLRDLALRWSVSTRTLERYRRKGLLALRLRPKRGPAQLHFVASSVAAFEARHADLLDAARVFVRASPGTRERVRTLARERPSGSLSRIAADVAPLVGLSTVTIRRMLHKDAPERFAARPRATPGARALALRLWREGFGPSEIAERLGVVRVTAHRLIDAERDRLVRSLGLGPPPFESDGLVLSDPLVRFELGEPGDVDAVTLAAAAARHEAPDPGRERRLAAAHHALLARAAALLASEARLAGRTLDEVETSLRWAALLRVELLRGERALIVRSIEERASAPLLELAPAEIRRWTAAAFAAAADALIRFDPAKRGRLATPVSLALARALAPLRPQPAPARRAHPANVPMTDWARVVAPWQSWLDPPNAVLGAIRDSLIDERATRALRHRFGLGLGPPLTFAQMKADHGVSSAAILRFLRLAASRAVSEGQPAGLRMPRA